MIPTKNSPFQTFWRRKSHLSQTFAENANLFLRISRPKNLLRCPELETRFLGPASHHWRLRAIVVLGVHRGAFREQKLCSLHAAVSRSLADRHFASGAFPGPSAAAASGGRPRGRSRGRRRTLWAAELRTRSTDKRTMKVSGFNIFKTVQSKKAFTNTLNKFQYRSFLQLPLPSMKRFIKYHNNLLFKH